MTDISRGSPSGPRSRFKASVALSSAPVAGTATVTLITLTVTGVKTTDVVVVNSQSAVNAGVALGQARVSATDTVEVPLINPTAAKVTVDTLTLSVDVFPSPVTAS
jgi:hypothetical protein